MFQRPSPFFSRIVSLMFTHSLLAKIRAYSKLAVSLVLLTSVATSAWAEEENDPDLPAFAARMGMSKAEYLEARSLEIAKRRGVSKDEPYDVSRRLDALSVLEAQQRALPPALSAYQWESIGPEPIPNGQTATVSNAVSGRTIALAVHPSNPNIVYSGTANGGLYRTLDGGATWRAMTDSIASLAIGAVTIDPSNPTTLWIGTGEGNGSADSFAGVGLYRCWALPHHQRGISHPHRRRAVHHPSCWLRQQRR
jgi:hypothetical protein